MANADPSKTGEGKPPKADNYELFLSRFTECEGRLRAYLWSMLPTWEGVDEVMQNASLIMWRKFDQYDPDTLFVKWATVICRFEALKYRRTKARDRHVFSDDLLEILGREEAEEDEELFRREKIALRECLKEVPEQHRKILLAAYAKGAKIKEVAEEAGRTPTSVYKMLNRLRTKLGECIEAKMAAMQE